MICLHMGGHKETCNACYRLLQDEVKALRAEIVRKQETIERLAEAHAQRFDRAADRIERRRRLPRDVGHGIVHSG